MADWKKGLRQAADQLGLVPQAKAKVTVQVSKPPLERQVVKVADERPTAPRKPGYPSNSARQSVPTIKARNRPPLPPPFSNPQPVRAKSVLRKSGSPGRAVKPAHELPAKPHFAAPNMTQFTIHHGASDASSDQRWQQLGTELTLRAPQNRGRNQCTLGLDFGTAFTKACVQFRQSTFIIQWDQSVPHCTPFLLPSVFTVTPDGSCILGTASVGRVLSDLKMALLSGASAESKINAIAFLALVTRYIRSWLFTQHDSSFRGFQLEWFINVGLPAVPWDNLGLRDLYRTIAFAGWQLGSTAGPITIEAAASVLSRMHANTNLRLGELRHERFAAFPEFVAQINSYRKSPQRRRDLHLLVDVGAGTVDAVTFHVWEPEEEDCYSILEASVENRGTHVLLGYRAQACGLKHSFWDEGIARLPITEFESTFGLKRGDLRPVQEFFVDQFHISLGQLLRKTKARRYETSPAWKEGVPFFLCGGGRNIDAYRESIKRIGTTWNLMEMQLPWPHGMVPGKLLERDFHRVAVAHGLSYSADNIGQIERKSEVPDLFRSQLATVEYGERYIEK